MNVVLAVSVEEPVADIDLLPPVVSSTVSTVPVYVKLPVLVAVVDVGNPENAVVPVSVIESRAPKPVSLMSTL